MPDQGYAPVTRSWTVSADQEGIRLDAFLRRCLPHLSLREARRAIGEGAFWIDARQGRKGDRLFSGSVLVLRGYSYLLAESPAPEGDLNVPVLYEDECLLALDKPAGMATHGFSGRKTRTLANFLAALCPPLVGVGATRWEVGLVHRLDRETSGIVLAAKDQDTYLHLRAQFRRGTVQKRYWALVLGKTQKNGIIDAALMHDPKDRRKMRPYVEEGKRTRQGKTWKAWTRFQTLGYSRGFSLLRLEIGTGVTHQIRVHLKSLGHPLVGDSLYGQDRAQLLAPGRHFLHACHLRFCHPKSSEEMTLECSLPIELREILKDLKLPCP